MTYSINGQAFVIPPTSGKWVQPEAVGIDGNGHPVYPAFTNYELEWNNLEPSGTYQLYEFFRLMDVTGSAAVSLPGYGFNSYTFNIYSGCVIYIPDFGRYFTEQTLDVRLTISRIRYDTFS